MAPLDEKTDSSEGKVSSECSSVSPSHTMLLRSSCKQTGCSAGADCVAHVRVHSRSSKSVQESFTKPHHIAVVGTLSSANDFSDTHEAQLSSRESYKLVNKSIFSSSKTFVQSVDQAFKQELSYRNGSRSVSALSAAQSYEHQSISSAKSNDWKVLRQNKAHRRAESAHKENSHSSSSVIATAMARTFYKRTSQTGTQTFPESEGDDNALRRPSSLFSEDILSSTWKAEASGSRPQSQSSVWQQSTLSESDAVSRLNTQNDESSRLAFGSHGYSDDESDSVYAISSHSESQTQRGFGNLRSWRKYVYFGLCKPTHYDLENLASISNFGKKKAIFLMLLPLLLWLIGDSFHGNDTWKNFGQPVVYILGKVLSCFIPLIQVLGRKDIALETGAQIHSQCHPSWWPFSPVLVADFCQEGRVVAGSENPVGPDAAAAAQSSHFSPGHRPPDSYMNKEEVRSLIQEILREEVTARVSQASEQGNNLRNQEILKIQKEVAAFRTEFKSFTDVMQSMQTAKLKHEKSVDVAKLSQQQALELQQLKGKLGSLESRLAMLDSLLVSAKNCCRNETNSSTVEEHFATVLLSIMDESGKPVSPSLKPFKEWLSSKFLNDQSISEQLKVLSAKVRSSNESAKAAAVTFVKQYVDSVRRELIVDTSKVAHTLGESGLLSVEDVRKMVRDAIFRYDADKTGQTDYALESGGGSVVNTRCSETYSDRSPRVTIFGIPLWSTSSSPRTAIQPAVHPGECWAFKGSQGFLVIQLASPIRPSAFVIEHIPKSLSPTGNINSAPKEFSVWGLASEKDNDGKLLGQYMYDRDGDPLQYFPVQEDDGSIFSFVELKIHSNQGEMTYTCLYRFRVHGSRQ